MTESELFAIHELFPIKLVGGFIVVDYHVGCLGCSFCISRRHPIWGPVFERNLQFNPPDLTPEAVFALLRRMKSFVAARVPVRFGHNTDAALQWEFGERLYACLPDDTPFIMLTRLPLKANQLRLFQGQPNLLLKITITPPSGLLRIHCDLKALTACLHRMNPENLYILIGPVARDSLGHVRPLLKQLPPGVWLDIKPLTIQGIPGMKPEFCCAEAEIDALREFAAEQGFQVTDYFGCKIRQKLGRGFYKAPSGAPYLQRTCAGCVNYQICRQPRDLVMVEAQVRTLAATIGLTLKSAAPTGSALRFACEAPTSRGDETFLSEMMNYEILLIQERQGTEGGEFCHESPEIHERWTQCGMFPYPSLMPQAEAIYRHIKARLRAA